MEAMDDPAATIAHARKHDFRVGLAVNPETPVEEAFPHLDLTDSVLVMTLYRTGWAGQPFNDEMLAKIERARAEIDRRELSVDIEVDGGINDDTARRCMDAGATVIAAASSIFKSGDPGSAARRLSMIAKGE